jgi:hypothetical protein
MASPRRALLAVALLPVLAFAACGGDDDSSSSASGSTTTTSGDSAGSTTSTTAAAGTGKGTLKIGGKELAFDAKKCSVGGSDDQPSFAAEGTGSADGKNFTVVVKRSPSSNSVIETLQLAFSATESIVGTKFVQLPDGKADSAVKVEDKTATGTLEFLGSGGQPSGEGTFTVTCD